MDNDLEALLFPIKSGAVDVNAGRTLFLNGRENSALKGFANLDIVQHFKPYADALAAHGRSVLTDIAGGSYDAALVLVPKNMVEARFMLAQAITALKDGGMLVCAADNKAGGGRLKKMFQDFGLNGVQEDSRNKARVVWARTGIGNKAIENVLQAGMPQAIAEGRFVSQPGIFGWDKIDKGSEILAGCLPRDLRGNGADFGCGYGYLARHILENNEYVRNLLCADADFRAVEMCRKNLESHAARARFLWADLTRPLQENLDFIVMNPPFHEGKNADAVIGARFIQTACGVLVRGGSLWMVANAHLPYESILLQLFISCTKIYEGQGFKVYHAVKR